MSSPGSKRKQPPLHVPTEPPDPRRDARNQNNAALDAHEKAALLDLFRRSQRAIRGRRGATARDLGVELEQAWTESLTSRRALSRAAGLSRLRAEATALGFALPVTLERAGELAERGIDRVRATRAARALAARWHGITTVTQSPAVALKALVGSLSRTAVTENADAFNAGRTRALRRSAPQLLLWRVWDSESDACERCRRSEGTIVGIRENFPDGEPGSVHPRCRCTWSLLPVQIAPL